MIISLNRDTACHPDLSYFYFSVHDHNQIPKCADTNKSLFILCPQLSLNLVMSESLINVTIFKPWCHHVRNWTNEPIIPYTFCFWTDLRVTHLFHIRVNVQLFERSSLLRVLHSWSSTWKWINCNGVTERRTTIN